MRGLRSIEEGDIIEDRDPELPPEAVNDDMVASYMAVALEDAAGQLVFDDAEQVKRLPSHIFDALGDGTLTGLAVVSPSYVLSDEPSWSSALEDGARSAFNVGEAGLMADAADYLVGKSVHPVRRPERYYGLPPSDLTDGQRMAYWAGVKVIKELRHER